jgi:hypothetical protein
MRLYEHRIENINHIIYARCQMPDGMSLNVNRRNLNNMYIVQHSPSSMCVILVSLCSFLHVSPSLPSAFPLFTIGRVL